MLEFLLNIKLPVLVWIMLITFIKLLPLMILVIVISLIISKKIDKYEERHEKNIKSK